MKKWLLILLIIVVITLVVVGGFFIRSPVPQRIHDQNISGIFMGDQIWSGEIVVTGDVVVLEDLTILPGTIVKFAVQDDQQKSYETPADGYNDLDPTRLLSYGKTHSSLTIRGRLSAVGTAEKRILFTSAADNPKIADWEAIYPHGDGSVIEHAVIEWSRNGISPGDEPTPNSIFQNNVIRSTMWGAVSLGWSSARAYNNTVQGCGHEGIDVQGGNPVIENNTVHDCHVGIVILRGSAVVRNNKITNSGGGPDNTGIHVGGDATPTIENNYFEAAPEDSELKWCYENFCYIIHGDPVGTPTLTEVYKEKLPRYAVPAYRIENQDYTVKLPVEAGEWLFYGWKTDKWQKIDVNVMQGEGYLPPNYSMYVLIPNPTENEKDVERFNREHKDIYKIMAV